MSAIEDIVIALGKVTHAHQEALVELENVDTGPADEGSPLLAEHLLEEAATQTLHAMQLLGALHIDVSHQRLRLLREYPDAFPARNPEDPRDR